MILTSFGLDLLEMEDMEITQDISEKAALYEECRRILNTKFSTYPFDVHVFTR